MQAIGTLISGLVFFGAFLGVAATTGVVGIGNAIDNTLPKEHDHIVIVGEDTTTPRICNQLNGQCIPYK